MNMGAGLLLRTVSSRAAGSTTPAGSNAFCSSYTGQVTRPSSLRAGSSCNSGHRNSNGPISQQATTSPAPVEFDDWEFADDPFVENRPNFPVSHAENMTLASSSSSASLSALGEDPPAPDNQFWHVFGMPPSFEEANAATMELQAAVFPSHDSGVDIIQSSLGDEMKSSSSSSLNSAYGVPFSNGAPIQRDNEGGADPRWGGPAWIEPYLYTSNRGMVQLSSSPVLDAFELLQSDPHVKGAVISIVSDPDVWSAMMKNVKVQELKRILERSQGQGEESLCSCVCKEEPSDNTENHDWIHGVSHVVHSIIRASKQVLCQVHEDLSKFIMSICAALSGTVCPPKKDDPFDKTMRSSMMLAVLVVTVVILKRLHI